MTWWTTGIAAVAAIVLLAAAVMWGRLRWSRASERLLIKLRGGRQPEPRTFPAAAELDSLPPPVARYLRLALGNHAQPGAPLPGWAMLRQRGSMHMSPGEQGWKPFTALQNISARAPGFVWEASISMAPGLSVQVRDSYVAGAGAMQASMLGLFTVVNQQGTPQIASASLQRWLAEAPWLPTALLPESLQADALQAAGALRGNVAGSTILRWEAIDDSRALAILRDSAPGAADRSSTGSARPAEDGAAGNAATEVSIEFRFNASGEVESIFCPDRFRDVKGTAVATPWEGRFSEYRDFDGIRIPTRGEVGWHIDGEYQPYWRGRVEDISIF